MQEHSLSVLSSESSFHEGQELDEKKQLHFLQRSANKQLRFEETWLHQVATENKQKIERRMKQQVGNKNEKFKYLFQVPLVVTDPKLVRRRKTYEIFAKNQQLEMYYLQLKKAKGIARTISQKADYKEVVAQINNNKVQDKNFEKFRKDRGIIYTNELWSQKLNSQIYDQSRLKELSELLEMKKIKMSYDEQLIQFERFFQQHAAAPEKKLKQEQLVRQIGTAFNLPVDEDALQPKTLLNYFKKQGVDSTDISTKASRLASRNQSQLRPNTSEYSIFSRRGSTSQLHLRSSKSALNLQSTEEQLVKVLKETEDQNTDTKETVARMRRFFRKEQEIISYQQEMKEHQFKIRNMKNSLEMKRNKELNSFIAARLNL